MEWEVWEISRYDKELAKCLQRNVRLEEGDGKGKIGRWRQSFQIKVHFSVGKFPNYRQSFDYPAIR